MSKTGVRRPSGGPPPSRFEYSAGGVVQDGAALLMVRVQNLEGKVVWTFPKGHIEKRESAQQAALREVEEETGYACEVMKPLERVQYYFQRDGQTTKKTVTWFLMKPLSKTGSHDTEEILETEWVSLAEARQRVTYKSDKKLLLKLAAAKT